MILSLLKVKILCYKNKFNYKDLLLYSFALIFPFFVYNFSYLFLSELIKHPSFKELILKNMLSYMFCAFSLMITSAALISSVRNLYSSKDMDLLKVLPIPKIKLLTFKFLNLTIESSWMILLFFTPILLSLLALKNTTFLSSLLALFAVLLLITLSCSVAVLISNFIVKKLGVKASIEIVIFTLSCLIVYFVIFSNAANPNLNNSKESVEEFITLFSNSYNKSYLPHSLCAEVLFQSWNYNSSYSSIGVLLLENVFFFALAYLSFNPNYITKNKTYLSKKNRLHFKFEDSFFFSLAKKEIKLIIRDFNQSTQFFLLIIITFVYLLNFQNLKDTKEIININWWQTMLAVSNISLGTCVLTAISTRFIFPCISIEGKSYELLRTLPISKTQLIKYKYIIWSSALLIISTVIFCSGALAIDSNFKTIASTAVLAICISLSIASSAIMYGVKYVKFDWEHPTQVSASFGSLMFMSKTFFKVYVYLIFSTILFICANVEIENNLITTIGTLSLLSIYTFYNCKKNLNKAFKYEI